MSTDLSTTKFFSERLQHSAAILLRDSEVAPPFIEMLQESKQLASLLLDRERLQQVEEILLGSANPFARLFGVMVLKEAVMHMGTDVLVHLLPMLKDSNDVTRFHAAWGAIATRSTRHEVLAQLEQALCLPGEATGTDQKLHSLVRRQVAHLAVRRAEVTSTVLETRVARNLGLAMRVPIAWRQRKSKWFPTIRWIRSLQLSYPEGIEFHALERPSVHLSLDVRRDFSGSGLEDWLVENSCDGGGPVDFVRSTERIDIGGGWQGVFGVDAPPSPAMGEGQHVHRYRVVVTRRNTLVAYSATAPCADAPVWQDLLIEIVRSMKSPGSER